MEARHATLHVLPPVADLQDQQGPATAPRSRPAPHPPRVHAFETGVRRMPG